MLVGAEFTQAWAEQVGAGIDDQAPGEDTPTPTVGGANSEVNPVALPRDPAPYSGATPTDAPGTPSS